MRAQFSIQMPVRFRLLSKVIALHFIYCIERNVSVWKFAGRCSLFTAAPSAKVIVLNAVLPDAFTSSKRLQPERSKLGKFV